MHAFAEADIQIPIINRGVNQKLDLLAGELHDMEWQLLGFRKPSGLEVMCGQLWTATPSYTRDVRPLPGEEEVHKRNEGVGIMMTKLATAAWKEA